MRDRKTAPNEQEKFQFAYLHAQVRFFEQASSQVRLIRDKEPVKNTRQSVDMIYTDKNILSIKNNLMKGTEWLPLSLLEPCNGCKKISIK